MKKNMFILVFAGFFTAMFLSVLAETIEKKNYVTSRVSTKPPIIDGNLNDSAWQAVEWESNFIQHDPYEGVEPSQRTSFKILYDNNNMYFAVRAHDTEADKIDARLARRDEIGGDFIGLQIDSYFDHRTAFTFMVNAGGVKMDGIFTNDGEDEDWTLDPIWYAKTSIDENGWSAEIKIPLSQLRYGKKEVQIWGLQVSRMLHRKTELSLWQHIPKSAPGWTHNFGELQGITGLKPPRRIEFLPYIVGQVETMKPEAGNPYITGHKKTLNFGLDGKIGLSSDLTVDFTINPDFGQVEADPSVVNLTAYETYFEEKRPFFIEGKNIFAYSLMIGDGDNANNNLFYSRRIGRSPSYYPDTKKGEYVNMPQNSTILGAMKLSGKTKKGLSIGILDAVTQAENAEIDNNGERRFKAVAPLTNYFISRIQKDLNDGATSFGGVFTNTSRNISHKHLEYLNKTAYTGGFDFSHRWKERTWFIQAKTVFSHIAGTKEAMLRQQRSSRRYFQRPDQNYMEVDSNRTSLSGYGGSLFFGRQGNSHVNFMVGGYWNSPGFEINDIGYMRQTDQIMQFCWTGLSWWKPFSIFRSMNISISQWNAWSFGKEKLGSGGNFNINAQFKNFWRYNFGVNYQSRQFSTTLLRGGDGMYLPSNFGFFMSLHTDQKKVVSFNINGNYSKKKDKFSRNKNLSAGISFRPTKMFSISLNPFYNVNRNDLQYVKGFDYLDDRRYIFGRLTQQTIGMVIRFNYNVSPDLSIQYYGQPFISAGAYSGLKYIINPRADIYANRFHVFTGNEIEYRAAVEAYYLDEQGDGSVDYTVSNPDFNFRQFQSNLIIRWEYSPGSTIYFVWSQGRTGSGGNAFSPQLDMRELFTVHPHNVFLVKFNHWFSL